MADKSAIEWTDATWNPIRARNKKTGKVGWHCEHATTGCINCYAEGFNKRLGTGLDFKPGHRADIELFLDQEMLAQPLRWKKPRMIFPNSMTDLFADFVPFEWIDEIFAVMALTPQHTYQPLTKRAARMQQYLTVDRARIGAEVLGTYECIYNAMGGLGRQGLTELHPYRAAFPNGMPWPLPNVWLGVSAERQEEADERIPRLLQTPAAIRFISAEPLLGPIDLTCIRIQLAAESSMTRNALHARDSLNLGSEEYRLDWVIVGGESGPGARPMHPDWARSLREQCLAAGVSFFFKQWGEWAPSTPEQAAGNPRSGWQTKRAHPCVAKAEELYPEAGAAFIERVGKKAAGRMLDGELHNAMPARPA